MPEKSQVVLSGIVLSIIYFFTKIIYNIYFHPLARFPGPPLHGGLLAVEVWQHWIGNESWKDKTLHEKYGPVVRVNPNSLSFNTAQAWKDIAGTRAGKKQLQKDPTVLFQRTDNPDIITANDKDHSRMRRLIGHAFSDVALREQEPLITKYFDLLIQKLNQQIDGPARGKVDMTAWYNFTTFDIIGDLAFGEPFEALEQGKYHFWITYIFRAVKFRRVVYTVNAYNLLWLFKLVYRLPGVGNVHRETFQFEVDRANKRLASKTDRKDFISYILRYNDERGMSTEEIRGNSGILIVAGSETTATVLSGATYHLLKNPHTLKRLTAEVRERFQTADEMNVVSTSQLPYLQAVLEESHRIYPAVPARLPRRTGAEVEIVDGYHIPPYTTVGVSQYATHHSESNFHNAEAFVPERWLPNAPKEYANDVKAAMQPFAIGPRNCAGRNLASVEMRSILARMVWHFDWELDPESKYWAADGMQKSWIMWEKPPLWIKLSRRDGIR